jgi:lactate dehydrogenase-like 2-hydroxyacid dehydrogenase
MHIGRLRSSRWRATIGTTRAKKLKASFNVWVTRVQFRCPLIGVQRIGNLIVARLVLFAKLITNYTKKKTKKKKEKKENCQSGP